MYEKLKAISENEALAKEIFTGTEAEIREKLAANGIELSDEDFADLMKGLSAPKDGELNEEALNNVAGGCGICYGIGYAIGWVIGKLRR